MPTYGTIIECHIERSTLDTDDIVLNLSKNKAAFDITGWTADITVNTLKDGSGTNVFEASGVVLGAAINAQIAIDMTAFNSVAAGKYFHDIRVIDASSKGRESLAGKFTVTKRIPKS